MSLVLRGGKPRTFRYDVTADGGEYALEGTGGELIFRPQAGSGRIFWDADTFAAGTDYVSLNGDASSGEFRLRASADRIWMTGPFEVEITVVTQA